MTRRLIAQNALQDASIQVCVTSHVKDRFQRMATRRLQDQATVPKTPSSYLRMVVEALIESDSEERAFQILQARRLEAS